MYSLTEFRAHTKQAFDRAIISPVKVLRDEKVFYLLSEKQYKQLQVDFIRNMMQNPSQDTKTQPVAPVKVEQTIDDKVWGIYIEMTDHPVKEWITELEADELIKKHDINGEMVKRKIR